MASVSTTEADVAEAIEASPRRPRPSGSSRGCILADLATATTDLASAQAEIDTLTTELEDAQVTLDALAGSSLVDLADYVAVDPASNSVSFVGANVYVVSGSGRTDDLGNLTGLGNLYVGYNGPETGSEIVTGSHNLIVGDAHTVTGYGNVVGGFSNTSTASLGAVFGKSNTVSGDYGAVAGGQLNEASGTHAAVCGGASGVASGGSATVCGGRENAAIHAAGGWVPMVAALSVAQALGLWWEQRAPGSVTPSRRWRLALLASGIEGLLGTPLILLVVPSGELWLLAVALGIGLPLHALVSWWGLGYGVKLAERARRAGGG